MASVVGAWAGRLAVGVATVAWLGGCAVEPVRSVPGEVPGEAPAVRLGPLIALTSSPSRPGALAALIDPAGNAHVVAADTDAGTLVHVRVTPAGDVLRQTVVVGSLDDRHVRMRAALDEQGRLHVLVNTAYWFEQGDTWLVSRETPWALAGIEARPLGLAAPGGGLTWLFVVDGEAVNAPGRWDWFGFGGPGAAIVFPWHVSSSKLVIAPGSGAPRGRWRLVDPEDSLDVRDAITSVDGQERLHVAYTVSRRGLLASGLPRYLRVSPPGAEAPPGDALARASVIGEQIPVLDLTLDWMDGAAMAADAPGERVMFVTESGLSVFREGARWRVPERLAAGRLDAPILAAAGTGAFHLIAVDEGGVAYRLFSQGRWSAPVALEGAARTKPADRFSTATGLGAVGGRVFASWSTPSGVVGRWIDAGEALASASLEAPRGGVPADLRDFAAGRATLVDPGWISGFSEAAVAGVHTALARRLHDDAQWEALATLILNDHYGDDVRWYFLGRAAEGLGWCDAALAYYGKSEAQGAQFITRCLGRACAGIRVREALAERRLALEAARQAGHCRESLEGGRSSAPAANELSGAGTFCPEQKGLMDKMSLCLSLLR